MLAVGEREVFVFRLAEKAGDFAECIESAELFLPRNVLRLLRREIVLQQENALIRNFYLNKVSVYVSE
jgi:hypothetical protein